MYGTHQFEIHKGLFESMSILNSKTKTPKTNLTAKRILSLHIHHLICGVRVLQIWNSQESCLKVCLFWIQKQKHQKQFIRQENLILAYSPPHLAVYGSYEFEIHKVLFESMSILNSKTKTPKKIYPPRSILSLHIHHLIRGVLRIWNSQEPVWKYGIQKQKHQKQFIRQEHLILAYSPPHVGCTGLTNLKFTRSCLKVCLFWIQKQKHQKQFIRQEHLILAYSPPHLQCMGVTNLKFSWCYWKICLF